MKNRVLLMSMATLLGLGASAAMADPKISRMSPPSQLFATAGAQAAPMISRFLPGQRFDLQATIIPDAGSSITQIFGAIDDVPLSAPAGVISIVPATAIVKVSPGAVVASLRGYSNATVGVHTLTISATQSNGKTVTAKGNFEIVGLQTGTNKIKNVIFMLGDGMGASQRTAARIMMNGYSQGKVNTKMAMDTFPNTAMIMTASLNSIVTDSAPGMQNYVTGNKAQNNQEGVWPDDTSDKFDNPRVEYVSEYLARTQGKKLGIVTTADVFDATPASNAIHTQDRGAGTGIVDQFFDDADKTGLTVLMGGGRKWFLPATAVGSARSDSSDYVLPSDVVAGWNVASGKLDKSRDLIAEFQAAGWSYAPDKTTLTAGNTPKKLLGLFAFSNMNVALDKIDGRRGSSKVVSDYGFTDQPLLDEMTSKALQVLDANSPQGFVLMVEAASIDKQAHNMDTERMLLDVIEFDHAIKVAQDYAKAHTDTLVIVTADHETAGTTIIGASKVTDAVLQTKEATVKTMRDDVVGNYDAAGFPKYTLAADGFPTTTNVDYRLLIGYGANADRNEDWRTNPEPIHDTQQSLDKTAPLLSAPKLNTYDTDARNIRDADKGLFITGQVAGSSAVHSGGDIPLSAYGLGSDLFKGTIDNTDVFFALMQGVVGGTSFK